MKNLLIAFGAGAVIATAVAFIVANKSAAPAPTSEIVIAKVEEPKKEEIKAEDETKPSAMPAPPTPAPIAKTPIVIERPAPQPRNKPREVARSNKTRLDENTIVIPPPAPIQIPPANVEAPKETAHIEPPRLPQQPVEERPARVEILKPDPPKQREPQSVTIAAGTQIAVRLAETISSETIKTGDAFHATLADPIILNGFVIAEKGARVTGRVVDSTRAGRVKGTAALTLELVDFASTDGQRVEVKTETFTREGPTSKGSDAAKVGAGAAVGAALGAIFGGGKGAAIGAASGAGAGAGTVALTRGKPAVLEVETRIPFQLKSSVTITEKLR